MANEQNRADQARRNESYIPSSVDNVLVFFYAVVWIDLLAVSYSVLREDPRLDTRYLVPLSLYGLLLLGFPVLHWRRFSKGEGKWSDLLWGYHGQRAHGVAFVLLSFALVCWLSLLNQGFASLYLVLLGVTAGILQDVPYLRWPLIAAEFGAFAVQSGLWEQWSKSGFPLYDGQVLGVLLIMGVTVAYIVLVQVLIRSRIESEILVRELQATKAQLEDALQKEKEVAVLKERNRMAREMHDVLGHALSLVAVKIEAAQRLQPVDPQRASAELEATKDLVRRSMSDLRASLADLRGSEPDAASGALLTSLGGWVDKVARETGLTSECSFEESTRQLPAPVQDALWRVGREAVLNVVKHARAGHLSVNAFCKDGKAYLTVIDDGTGIPHLKEGTARLEVDGHYGVRGMRERLEALGGTLSMHAAHNGRGTMLLACVPLPASYPPPEPHTAPRDRSGERSLSMSRLWARGRRT